ncbi:hypothetical protein TeGR_g2266, partial [Tetraparma gracilis]
YFIALVAVLKTFDSVVYWRQLVANLLDITAGKRDPLKKFDKVPWLKRLVKAWKDDFAIEGGGKYSIVLVVGIELVEFVTQSTSASRLARHLDWKYLGAYVQLIAGNALLFGVCLIVPEQYMSISGMVAVDVIIDATYVLFNTTVVKTVESYWPIIIPLAFAVNTPSKSFQRQAQLKVNEIAPSISSEEEEGGGGAPNLPSKPSAARLASVLGDVKSKAKKKVDATILRRAIGLFFVITGGSVMAYSSGAASSQKEKCEAEFGVCVWERIEPKLYFKSGFTSSVMCGFGVDQNPNKDSWQLDVSGCGAEEFSLGTDLPIVRSAEANERLAAGAAKLGVPRIWLGASDEEKEGEWVWVDGTPVAFEGWANNQPDNWGSGEEFATLRTASAEWNDLSDYFEVEFLCEGDGLFPCPPSEQPDLVSGGCEPFSI